MITEIYTADFIGIDAYEIVVEVDSRVGMPGFHLVGMASVAVTEGRVRIRTAIENSGFHLKSKKVTVNLAPAEIRKDTTAFDLPIAIGVIAVDSSLSSEIFRNILFIGELGLDGTIRPVRGVLPITVAARNLGYKAIVVPRENAREAALIDGIDIKIADTLSQVMGCLNGLLDWDNAVSDQFEEDDMEIPDFADVVGQKKAIRAMTVAASGGHNILMVGPPGSGKSMLARRLPGILPPMNQTGSIECTTIYSVAGALSKTGLITRRPFRAPHHTVTSAGLVGGGPGPRPGEISLAHNGVLFLDEILEFSRNTLETLRQPLEDGNVTITRARGSINFPAKFQLVAAMNPCPCGHFGDKKRECICSQKTIMNYRNRLSGPLMDRIDIQVHVGSMSFSEIRAQRSASLSTSELRKMVLNGWKKQLLRFGPSTSMDNAHMTGSMIKKYCTLDTETESFLENAVENNSMSVRSIDKILKIARTVADLDNSENIQFEHLKEAVTYREIESEKII
ncbi:MAG: YifB family Mg chelatase-like AAA ATPase [Deltaproteobacteria bacterium]|nr:YifB family Mg chelatase-like AAA ATPase [Deltaproteobacteria bacterium]